MDRRIRSTLSIYTLTFNFRIDELELKAVSEAAEVAVGPTGSIMADPAQSPEDRTGISTINFTQPLMRDPSPTLPLLPRELLIHIADNLDIPSAKSFALVARCFTSPAESRLWRDINLVTPSPPPFPFATATAEQRADVVIGPMSIRFSEDVEAEEMQERLDAVLKAGDARRFSLVRSVQLAPRTETGKRVALLLEEVSKTVEELLVEQPQRSWPIDTDVLDFPLQQLNDKITSSFPALTHIRLEQCSFDSITVIPLLCNACPRLVSLDFNHTPVTNDFWGSRDGPLVQFPTMFIRPTSIVTLRIYISSEPLEVVRKVVLDLLANAPRLRRLNLPPPRVAYQMSNNQEFLPHLGHMKDLVFVDLGAVAPESIPED